MLQLEYYNETKEPVSARIFEDLLEIINTHFRKIFPKSLDKRKNYLVTLTLVNDKLIQKINKEHRGVDKPTDVVSLSYIGDEFPGQDMIGEVFISIDSAEKQAKKLEHDIRTEMKFLFIHGILHILGYEHAGEEDFQLMMDLTNEILSSTSSST